MLERTLLALSLVLGLVVVAACPKAGVDKAETATAAPSPPWWMSLKDGKLHRGLDDRLSVDDARSRRERVRHVVTARREVQAAAAFGRALLEVDGAHAQQHEVRALDRVAHALVLRELVHAREHASRRQHLRCGV